MKKLIFILSLCFCFNALAQGTSEPSWKMKLREVITQVAGAEWSNKLLGAAPVAEVSPVAMPEIPVQLKSTTDVGSYTKKVKEPTEFDKLPKDRQRQFDYKFIEELFLVTRKTDAKDEDLANWLNTLDQGGSREGIYQALVLDDVYNGLESIPEKPTEQLLDFSLHFSEVFLNQTFNKDSLNQLNLYSIKRILTEKGLDLIEYYEVKDLDMLYRWYANFSADLAQKHGVHLKSQVRSEPSATYHYEWAKSMPIQHIKSEYIIKLHAVMNGQQLF